MFQWLRYFLGLTEPTPQASHTSPKQETIRYGFTSPKEETIRDAYDRGARFQEFQRSDLDPEFAARFLALCKADQNIEGLSLAWMTEKDLPRELFAALQVDRPDEHLVNKFVDRANALGGPRFVAAIAGPQANSGDRDGGKTFYRRGA
jgi:hypothetical protein